MSFFSKISDIFSKSNETPKICDPEAYVLVNFEEDVNLLLNQDLYLAHRDYSAICIQYKALYDKFKILEDTKTLGFFCKNNNITRKRINSFFQTYQDISSNNSTIIAKHNEDYITKQLVSNKQYLDNILKDVDPAINLDKEQRLVVLDDEDHLLVIAGAGAGKTTTIAAKVKYLVEKKNIAPEQILVISFTNKAVDELKDKINKRLNIPCPVTTFHKTGYAILKRQEQERKRIVTEGALYCIINDYLKTTILDNPELVDKIVLFFGTYFDAPYEGEDINNFFNFISKANFSTLKSNLQEYTENIIDKRFGKRISISAEHLRSYEEVVIANFLYLNNIDYVYEKAYPYHITDSYKLYTPDFTIKQGDKIAYIEHFGITEDGTNNRYSTEELNKYKQNVNNKIKLHRSHNTTLLYTFSAYKDKRHFLEHLKEQLIAKGFILTPRSSKEVFEKIINTEENKYISKFVKLICTFIQNFKANGYDSEYFKTLQKKTNNVRTKLFLTICEQCYHEYCKRLKEQNAIDFEDMINDSAKIIRDEELKGTKLDFQYIIVDEYQDISRQRFNLTKELSKLCNAKIVAVGDDWQSIYAYAGSDITLFTDFCNVFGSGEVLHITKTYRNSQELIDIAGNFIQKNEKQIKKHLISPKKLSKPIVIETYDEEVNKKDTKGKGGKYYLVGQTVEKIMKEIYKNNPKSSVLILGRYGFDAYNLCKSADFIYNATNGNLISKTFEEFEYEYMTVHRSKGLGYDNVIIINNVDANYGFPSKIQDDPILQLVVKEDKDIAFAEERRLFYVALTRTKNKVYLVTPQQRPSMFIR